LPDKRRDTLLNLLLSNKFHSIDELKKLTGAPHATLHRDLSALESEGLIRKTYGGVEVLSPKEAAIRKYEKRIGLNSDKKRAIAEAATKFVMPGEHIFLDASSTCYFLGKAIFEKNIEGVTIVTNSLHLLNEYRDSDTSVRLVSTGGSIDKELNAFLGELTIDFISRISISKTFISAAGCSAEHGISTSSDFILSTIKAAVAAARRRYCLIDSSKFDMEYLFKFAELKSFDAIISDSKIPRQSAEKIKSTETKLVIARQES